MLEDATGRWRAFSFRAAWGARPSRRSPSSSPTSPTTNTLPFRQQEPRDHANLRSFAAALRPARLAAPQRPILALPSTRSGFARPGHVAQSVQKPHERWPRARHTRVSAPSTADRSRGSRWRESRTGSSDPLVVASSLRGDSWRRVESKDVPCLELCSGGRGVRCGRGTDLPNSHGPTAVPSPRANGTGGTICQHGDGKTGATTGNLPRADEPQDGGPTGARLARAEANSSSLWPQTPARLSTRPRDFGSRRA